MRTADTLEPSMCVTRTRMCEVHAQRMYTRKNVRATGEFAHVSSVARTTQTADRNSPTPHPMSRPKHHGKTRVEESSIRSENDHVSFFPS